MNRSGHPFEQRVRVPIVPPAWGTRKDVRKVPEERFRGASVRTLPKPNTRYRPDRTCAAAGCATKLSIYNKWDYCWQHEPVHAYIPRGKRKRRDAA
jgi:hypothetical protein